MPFVTQHSDSSDSPDIPMPPHNQGANVKQGDSISPLGETLRKLREEVARINAEYQSRIASDPNTVHVDVIDYTNRIVNPDSQ